MELLQKLNIYGLNQIEDGIIAGLVSGDPVLLIGRHGSAKTLLVNRLSQALGLKFIAYDASKALFDDVVGFPNPKSLSEGMIDYIPTPISIWDKEFILIDEISRATPSMQNKWLEIIRSRQLMGKQIPNLKYVFAAMNPPGEYTGAMPLDPALVGRFAFIIHIPEIYQIEPEEIKKIISNISEDDAVALNSVLKSPMKVNKSDAQDLNSIVFSAQQLIQEISHKYDRFIQEYITKILANFLLHKIKLDGRRLGMLRRNCLAYIAVKTVKYGVKEVSKKFTDYLYQCLKFSLPNESIGEDLREDVLKAIHLNAVKSNDSSTQIANRAKIFLAETVTGMVENYISSYDKISDFDHIEFAGAILEKRTDIPTPDGLIDLYLAVKKLIEFYQQKADKCPLDAKRRICDLYSELNSITSVISEFYDSIFIDKNGKRRFEVINLNNRNENIALRLCLNSVKNSGDRNKPGFVPKNEFYESLKKRLKKHFLELETK